MRIKDIQNKELRELALLRQLEEKGINDENIHLINAFGWSETEEGDIFWENVFYKDVSSIEKGQHYIDENMRMRQEEREEDEIYIK